MPLPARAASPKERLDKKGPRVHHVAGCTMIFHRAFASRRRPERVSPGPRPRLRPLAALFGLSVLVGGLVLPAVSFVLADDPAPFCCSKGRCCCADDAAARDDRTCLRRGCGCDHRDEAVNGEPLRIEAVLCPPAAVTVAVAAAPPWASADERTIARAQPPSVPPPRRPLPA
jgi:hypothetical protein